MDRKWGKKRLKRRAVEERECEREGRSGGGRKDQERRGIPVENLKLSNYWHFGLFPIIFSSP